MEDRKEVVARAGGGGVAPTGNVAQKSWVRILRCETTVGAWREEKRSHNIGTYIMTLLIDQRVSTFACAIDHNGKETYAVNIVHRIAN